MPFNYGKSERRIRLGNRSPAKQSFLTILFPLGISFAFGQPPTGAWKPGKIWPIEIETSSGKYKLNVIVPGKEQVMGGIPCLRLSFQTPQGAPVQVPDNYTLAVSRDDGWPRDVRYVFFARMLPQPKLATTVAGIQEPLSGALLFSGSGPILAHYLFSLVLKGPLKSQNLTPLLETFGDVTFLTQAPPGLPLELVFPTESRTIKGKKSGASLELKKMVDGAEPGFWQGKNQDDSFDPQWKDLDPTSGGSADKIYAVDAPGVSQALRDAIVHTSEVYDNFQQWVTVDLGAGPQSCSYSGIWSYLAQVDLDKKGANKMDANVLSTTEIAIPFMSKLPITAASGPGMDKPVVITTSTTAGMATGDRVKISGVTGPLAPGINVVSSITLIDATTFSLDRVTTTGNAGPGGTWTRIGNKYSQR